MNWLGQVSQQNLGRSTALTQFEVIVITLTLRVGGKALCATSTPPFYG